MPFEYEATRDTSGLVNATGYWSGDVVYFNPDLNKIVIIDQKLAACDLKLLIRECLEANLKENLDRYLHDGHVRSKKPFLKWLTTSKIKDFFRITNVAAFNRPEFKRGGKPEWPLVAGWLADSYKTEASQRNALAGILADASLSDNSVVRFDKSNLTLMPLLHPWLDDALDSWKKASTSMEDVLSALAAAAYQDQFAMSTGITAKQFNAKADNLVSALRDRLILIHKAEKDVDLRGISTFLKGCAMLLGLLSVQNRILLPASIEPSRTLRLYQSIQEWGSLLDKVGVKKFDKKTLVFRMLACSTVRSPADIPGNVSEIIQFIPSTKIVSSTLSPILKDYAAENGLEAYPLNNLDRNKARRNAKPRVFTLEWLAYKEVPLAWQNFAKCFYSASDAGDALQRAYVRATIEWAWFESRFSGPMEIRPTDLRDPHHPDRKDTLHHFIKRKEILDKWQAWNSVQRAFSLVHNQGKTENNPLLPENPFQYLQNPFKINHSQSTHRHRIPMNLHEAMMQVLLSPDEDGNPTWSFVRDTLKWDWFDWKNPATDEIERTWCPSRARVLAFLLMLPPRSKQARWLDQGLMDQKIWDVKAQQYVENEHPLKDWRYPITGKTHLETYGRPSGVLQPIHDAWYNEDQLCIYINTNKTQMWDPAQVTGYEIWWPRGTQLREWDIANLAQQADYLDRPYWLIENQLLWLEQYDPDPSPVTFMDSSEDAGSVNRDLQEHYPYFIPLFRDLTSPYHREDGTEYFLPVSVSKLGRLYNALAVHTEERLRQQNLDVVLTEPNPKKNNKSYNGRKCRFDIHSLRVYGVSYLIELGIPWPIVQMIVGHKSPAMTLHYNKPSPEFIRQLLAEKIGGSDILSDWNEIGADLLQQKGRFIFMNPAFDSKGIQEDLFEEDYTGFVQKPGGMCPLGGTACQIGQIIETVTAANGATKITYGPVTGGCGNCRFFCTSPAHLFQHQMVINDLFIRIRSLGKQQAVMAERLGELQWVDCDELRISQESADLKSQLEEVERQIEPLVREWINRSEMATQALECLDDFLAFLKDRRAPGNALMLLSVSNAEELAPHIEMRMEKTGEFELARQTLLAAHLQGGIEHCSELSRRQVREFMDRIMVHDDPKHLLLHIRDEKTRDKVAFLMAEAMAAVVGSDAVQQALDSNKGLIDIGLDERQHQDLKTWVKGVFNNAKRQGNKATIASLLPPSLQVIDSTKEVDA